MANHPNGLYLLFFTEMWERFSYYGMRAIFLLFLIKALLVAPAEASGIYGSFTGLVYLSPLIGGYVSDRFWGNRKSVIFGGLFMAMGHFALFLSASFYQSDNAFGLMILGLGLLILGNGFFKPNISTMVGQLYDSDDKRIDSAYTIFYVGVNLGAFFSPLVCGTLGDTQNPADFRWGFLAACIGMIVSLIMFCRLKSKFLTTPSGKPVGCKPKPFVPDSNQAADARKWYEIVIYVFSTVSLFSAFYLLLDCDFIGSVIFSACIVVPIYILADKSLTKAERSRIIVIYVLAFFVIFFWAAYEQAGNAITLFTEQQVNRELFGQTVKTSYFQSLNPIFIVVLAPMVSALWSWLGRRNRDMSVCRKQALGILLLSASYLFLTYATDGLGSRTKVSVHFVVMYYLVSTIGELWLSPVGLAMINKLSPARFASLLMGVWYMSTAAANKFCGTLGSLYPVADENTGVVTPTSFMGYEVTNLHDFFLLFVIMTAASAVLLFAFSPKLEKMMR